MSATQTKKSLSMGWDQHFSGRIVFMRAAKPGSGEKDRVACQDGEEWEKLYHMIRDNTKDTRLLDYYSYDDTDDDTSMEYRISQEMHELRPQHVVELLYDMAKLIGQWGCYLDGNLFIYTEGAEDMSRVLIDKDKVRYYVYSHEDFEADEIVTKMEKIEERDLRDLLDPNGQVPPDENEEHKQECELEDEIERLKAELEERKRKRAEAKRRKRNELICPLTVDLRRKRVNFMHEGVEIQGDVYSEVGLPDKLLVRWKENFYDVAYQYARLNREDVLAWKDV